MVTYDGWDTYSPLTKFIIAWQQWFKKYIKYSCLTEHQSLQLWYTVHCCPFTKEISQLTGRCSFWLRPSSNESIFLHIPNSRKNQNRDSKLHFPLCGISLLRQYHVKKWDKLSQTKDLSICYISKIVGSMKMWLQRTWK